MSNAPTETPNTGLLPSPLGRKIVGGILYGISLLSAIASIIFFWFPELGDFVDVFRIVGAVNAIVSFLSGAFGIAITLPNIPKRS